jgi:PKD repeat protein
MRKFLKVAIVTAVCVFAANILKAQISQGGTPYTFSDPEFATVKSYVPLVQMPNVDVDALRQEDLINDHNKEIPWRFGQNIDVQLNMQNSGVWDTLANGDKIWRLRILSPGATSINLTFNNYHLPSGATLFIYNDDHSQVIGAFTDFNNRDDHMFATTLVKGEATNLEYYEPANVSFAGSVSINRVTHGYRGVKDWTKAFGDAGSCQTNVHCTLGTGWENQIRAVVMLVSGGSGFCSGSLVNNTANDGTPYILTANHCYSDPSTWVFWFNYEASGCTTPGTEPTANSISGATLKAKNAGSDFCLVQMSSVPPVSYNAYYAGWDRSGTAPTSGMGIHHPSADIKKISACGAMTAATYSSASCWQTPWSGAECTEGGSSGSPIFNQNKLIVGQLYGGPSACGASQMWDYYGRFDVSWTGGGTSSTRLSDWLDPATTGATTLQGLDPVGPAAPVANFSANVTTSCTGDIVFTDQSSNTPTSWSWNFGDGQTSALQNPAHTYTANGTYTVSLTATNAIGNNSVTKTSYITINMPAAPTVVGDTVCNSGAAILTASGSGILKWYSSASSNTVLGTGSPYTTPVISSTTNYYVEDSVAAPRIHGAKPDNSGAGSTLNAPTRYLIFDCLADMTLDSVKVWASSTGNRVIELRNSSGTVLASKTVNLTNTTGATQVYLGFTVSPGTNYQLGLNSTSACNLYRNNGSVSFPYTGGSLFTVTGSDAGATYYYYFYDWVARGKDCVSPRTMVTANVIVCAGLNENSDTRFSMYPNPANDKLNLSFNSLTDAVVNIQVFATTGQCIYSATETANTVYKTTLDVSSWAPGIYSVRVQNGDDVWIRKVSIQ